MNIKRNLTLAAATLVLAGCQMGPKVTTAIVEIKPTSAAAAAGLNPMGKVVFTQTGSGKVMVEATITGLKPNSEHGFHVHATPDCSGDGMATGAHFNPDGYAHTHPGQPFRHAGAMFNLRTDAQGVGQLRQDVSSISLHAGKYSIVGLPLITHLNADDYRSQPLGNAGARIACGLITAQG